MSQNQLTSDSHLMSCDEVVVSREPRYLVVYRDFFPCIVSF